MREVRAKAPPNDRAAPDAAAPKTSEYFRDSRRSTVGGIDVFHCPIDQDRNAQRRRITP